MDRRIEELTKLRKEALSLSCKEEGHTYGPWSENEENLYSRACTKCGIIEQIKANSPIQEIESEITKQNEAQELLEFLYNNSKEVLTSENIIFYIYAVKDYLNYIDKKLLQKRLKEVNTLDIDNEREFNLINAFTDIIMIEERHMTEEQEKQYDIIWQEINNYIQVLEQAKSPSSR